MFYLHNVGAPVLFYVFDEFIETRRQWLTMANSAVCLSCIRYNYVVVRLLVLFLLNRNEIINIEKLLIKVKTLLILKSVGAVRLFVTFVVNDWCLFQSFFWFFFQSLDGSRLFDCISVSFQWNYNQSKTHYIIMIGKYTVNEYHSSEVQKLVKIDSLKRNSMKRIKSCIIEEPNI